MALSDAQVRNAKAANRPYKLSDGKGLYLAIATSGTKSWRLTYWFQGRQKTWTIGRYPELKLADARTRAEQARAGLYDGIDPMAQANAAKAAPVNTFQALALEWLEVQKSNWKSDHFERVKGRLERDAFTQIGDMVPDDVTPADILAMIRRVEERGAIDISRRLKQTVGRIFRYGIPSGRCSRDPAGDIDPRDALRPRPRVKRMPKVALRGIPKLVYDISRYDGETITRLALQATLHSTTRTGETRFARKGELEELDGAEPLWRIPAARMKMGREHLVPLSRQGVAIFKAVLDMGLPGDFLFPGKKAGEPMSANTMIFALYRLGYHSRQTVHGFRGLFSTVLNEHDFDDDWVEMQLAHDEDDGSRAAYNSAQYLRQRRAMMQWWSDYLDGQQKTGVSYAIIGV